MSASVRGDRRWRKSSFSDASGEGDCVEVALRRDLRWQKSSFSGASGQGDCVEVAFEAAVRDSKDPDGPILAVDPGTWRRFVAFTSRVSR